MALPAISGTSAYFLGLGAVVIGIGTQIHNILTPEDKIENEIKDVEDNYILNHFKDLLKGIVESQGANIQSIGIDEVSSARRALFDVAKAFGLIRIKGEIRQDRAKVLQYIIIVFGVGIAGIPLIDAQFKNLMDYYMIFLLLIVFFGILVSVDRFKCGLKRDKEFEDLKKYMALGLGNIPISEEANNNV